jgi:hypothetical protein
VLLTDHSRLADALERWLQRTRLEKAVVARQGGLSRGTLYYILDGSPAEPDTLRKVARGLATDPFSKAFDPHLYADAIEELFAAAGYALPPNEVVRISLEDEVERLVRNRATAEQIVKVLEKFPELSTDKRTLLMAAIRNAMAD